MQLSLFSLRATLQMTACLCCANLGWAQSAARVMVISGSAKAVEPQGNERILQKGAELFAGDKVVTGDESLVQVRLHDGGYMSVRPNTEMVIDRFVYDEKDSSKSSFLVSLLRGGFRSITGLIGRTNPNGYQIRSKTATIGIRGTDHEPVVILETPGTPVLAPPGLYDKVNDGETFIANAGVVLPLRRGEVGFAPFSPDTPPRVLLKVPDFYKVDLKTDARDSKDGGDDNKADGNKRGANGLLRPSLAARREALTSSGGPTGSQPAVGSPASGDAAISTQPATTPAPTTTKATTTTNGTNAGTGTGTGTNTTPTPTLTPEQRRSILQGTTAPRVPPTTTPH